MRCLLALVLSLCLVVVASAEVPQQLHYNGYLTNAVGEALDCPDVLQCGESYTLTFRLYASSEGGAAIWEESYPAVPIFGGSFHVVLGTINPIGAELLNGPTWLAVKVNENVEMAPRQKVASAPYALRAETSAQAEVAANADQLGGVAASEYATQTILAPVATVGLSPDLADGDDDALGALVCGDGMVPKVTATGAWACGVDNVGGEDTTLSEEEVDVMVANNGFVLQAELVAAQTSLSELQTLVNGIDTSTGADISALQTQIAALQTALNNAETTLSGVQGDLSDEGAARSLGDNVLQSQIDGLDPIAKADLACADGQVAQFNGSAWECATGSGAFPTTESVACDESTVGKVYFDTVENALKVCDGTAYRKVKLCSEICPDASTVLCGQAVEDDCGSICGGTGTALNLSQCNVSTVSCGQAVLDPCSNDCGTTGTLLNPANCLDSATVVCGQPVTDSCGNGCGLTGTLCSSVTTPNCLVDVCTGHHIVAFGSGRRWGDASYAGSCNSYKNPETGYSYVGATGDGIYTLETNGKIFDVHCDMTTDSGGWTLAALHGPNRYDTPSIQWFSANTYAEAVTPSSSGTFGMAGNFSDISDLRVELRLGNPATAIHQVKFDWQDRSASDLPVGQTNDIVSNLSNADLLVHSEPGCFRGSNHFNQHFAIAWAARECGGTRAYLIGSHYNGTHQHWEEGLPHDDYDGEGYFYYMRGNHNTESLEAGSTSSDTGRVLFWIR